MPKPLPRNMPVIIRVKPTAQAEQQVAKGKRVAPVVWSAALLKERAVARAA
ncbi:MAG: hypothetical protein NPIRA01_04410 [Nitrospirales bacterium]|nr:MAG: hypothetical protein NPIRA01_04410 [Nitrospirales bacterium]